MGRRSRRKREKDEQEQEQIEGRHTGEHDADNTIRCGEGTADASVTSFDESGRGNNSERFHNNNPHPGPNPARTSAHQKSTKRRPEFSIESGDRERNSRMSSHRRPKDKRRKVLEEDEEEINSGKTKKTASIPVASARKVGKQQEQKLSSLQLKMRHKLEGAQFRMINEALYTSESSTSLAKFQEDPHLFGVYHKGFREQVEKWPVHPLDIIIRWLRKYPKARIADFGCGEARLAAVIPNKVFSFDLVAPNPRVTACDMAHVPLRDASVQIAVFCLSLMGTNLADFLREAYRVLIPGGIMKIAEVRSRFEGEKDGVERFLDVTKRLGFDQRQLDRTNKMFLLAEFKKSSREPHQGIEFEAKACVYKRR